MHNFKVLKVWQKSIDFAVDIYKATAFLPTDEKYGLIFQMKRASVSNSELETQVIIARLELLSDSTTMN
ncbi:four helix bundle protein [Solitalea koreensis]|uniref:Four helix bundle protein n=1 Tax=Solitalea koreensis TaxID=543615 RepID=A0A521AM14_9SPHI|nr:four helix bundle protein [Solitalea koreensis]SMO35874.1 four helix bundle protein [Solitalea koreensis]